MERRREGGKGGGKDGEERGLGLRKGGGEGDGEGGIVVCFGRVEIIVRPPT